MRTRRVVLLLLAMVAFGALTLPVAASTEPNAFDGDRCPGTAVWADSEWGAPDYVDGQDVPTGSADILNLWACLHGSGSDAYLCLAFNRRSSGSSSFSFYFNSDCSSSTGDTSHGGAEYAAFFIIGGSGSISDTTLYEWDSGSWVDTGLSFLALVGHYTCALAGSGPACDCESSTDGEFFEMQIFALDLFDPCQPATGTCNNLELTEVASLAGGWGSKEKDVVAAHLLYGITNHSPTANAGPDLPSECRNTPVTLDGSASTDPNLPPAGSDALTYEWDIDYDGTTFDVDTTGEIATHTYTSLGTYTVGLRVRDTWDCEDIDTLVVTISDCCFPPVITGDPASQSCVCVGGSASFSVSATGTPPFSYQWYKVGTPDTAVPGGTSDTLTIDPVAASDAGSYYCVVSNACSTGVSSASATLDVDTTNPVITTCPPTETVQCIGDVSSPADSWAGFVASGGAATDNCDTSLDASYSDSAPSGNCPTTITRTWTVTDDCSNSITCAQTITVNDTTNPVITTCPPTETVQ